MSSKGDKLTHILRFVPQGKVSLEDDAPGWEDTDGPTCWKCKGKKTVQTKLPKSDKAVIPNDLSTKINSSNVSSCKNNGNTFLGSLKFRNCPVCQGQGFLRKRKLSISLGKITRGRQKPNSSWQPHGPDPIAILRNDQWSKLIQEANNEYQDVMISLKDDQKEYPTWLPQPGEELCNLVGRWRILQRVGSHRWTTDDLVTAWVASSTLPAWNNHNTTIHYLDLGTGNSSVLQMVTWALLGRLSSAGNSPSVTSMGIEARSEAVSLARRSLAFNLGSDKEHDFVTIRHGDFRDAVIPSDHYHLITGTPPYFRVDFHVEQMSSTINNPDTATVSQAIIQQGGMPTSKQSAPARCEFRGGIEAYCAIASKALKKEDGCFVVCENWLNHDRVLAAADTHGLHIVRQVRVMGREQKGILFSVYVMKCCKLKVMQEPVIQQFAVRSMTGEWTKEYKELVLKTMSIPY
jgi:tRNA1Val (adenine37-N6)-methyltransferase